jgi:plastocyanin
MKTQQTFALVMGCIFIFAAGSAAAAKYKVKEVTDGGSVSGRITYDGTAPAPEILKVDEDVEACGGDRASDELLVSAGGGIQNVVISIDKIKAGKDWDLPTEKFTYDQKGCSFVPRIMVIKPKMAGEVLNSDSVGHNFHTISKGIFNINKKIQPGASLAVKKTKIRKTGMVRAKCDIHSWMGGYWVVADTPYTVLSDADGNFSITDIPAGKYKLKIWHEKLGETSQEVEVSAGADTSANAALKL